MGSQRFNSNSGVFSISVSATKLAALLSIPTYLLASVSWSAAADAPPPKRIAAIVTEYRHNSHADMIVSRLLLTDTLDGKGRDASLKLASLYTDQRPPNDISRLLAASHRFPIYDRIADALTLGTDELAVDGVLLIAEHGDYPRSSTGNQQYPKRRFWDEIIGVFRTSHRSVPVFVDKHLSDNWDDAQYIYDSARELKIPLMAGSSVPLTWRHPVADIEPNASVEEIVALTFHTTDAYGFHALEAVQALAEQRRGGETGVRAVQCLCDEEVWKAWDERRFDPELFQAAWERLPDHTDSWPALRNAVPHPKLLIMEYEDGVRAFLLELNGAVGGWSAAWRYADRRIESTHFWTQEARPGAHFTLLLHGIEQMMQTGEPAWKVERTLLTSGALDALLQSQQLSGKRMETPFLKVAYQPHWRWHEPPPPPPSRPWSEQ